MDSKLMELHLGVLLQRLARIKGKMNIAMAKSEMEKAEEKGINVEEEKNKFLDLSNEYAALEKELIEYEDKVMELTKI